MSLTRRSFFGVVVAGASALVLPRSKPKYQVMDVHLQLTYTPAEYDAMLEKTRRAFARIIEDYNRHSNYVPILPQGVERIDFVAVPQNGGPPVIRLPEITRVRVV